MHTTLVTFKLKRNLWCFYADTIFLFQFRICKPGVNLPFPLVSYIYAYKKMVVLPCTPLLVFLWLYGSLFFFWSACLNIIEKYILFLAGDHVTAIQYGEIVTMSYKWSEKWKITWSQMMRSLSPISFPISVNWSYQCSVSIALVGWWKLRFIHEWIVPWFFHFIQKILLSLACFKWSIIRQSLHKFHITLISSHHEMIDMHFFGIATSLGSFASRTK